MMPEAAAYLTEALEYIQRHALRSGNVDWQTVRVEALVRIQNAQTSADTYPTLRWVLSCLGDRHSFLLSPDGVKRGLEGRISALGLRAVYPEGVILDVHPGSPAEHAGLQVRDIIATINGKPRAELDRATFQRALRTSPVSLTARRAGREELYAVTLHAASYQREMKPQGWPLQPDIGYLELPALTGNKAITEAYTQTVQQFIRDMDQAAIRHWIIDLRRNTGGNMWPMIAGVCPLLGDGGYGFFLSPDGERASWLPGIAKLIRSLPEGAYCLKHPVVAIAVLTSRLTSSSGEFTTLAFRGAPRTRSFGEATAGLPTANQGKALRDGAQLFLTVAYGADRTGQIYTGPIMPDQPVTNDWTLFQTERDPVLLSAIAWLRRQPLAGDVAQGA